MVGVDKVLIYAFKKSTKAGDVLKESDVCHALNITAEHLQVVRGGLINRGLLQKIKTGVVLTPAGITFARSLSRSTG